MSYRFLLECAVEIVKVAKQLTNDKQLVQIVCGKKFQDTQLAKHQIHFLF